MSTDKASSTLDTRAYRPPQRLLIPCPRGCGATVLRGISIAGKVKKLAEPLSPVFGETHVCKALEEASGPQETSPDAAQYPCDAKNHSIAERD